MLQITIQGVPHAPHFETLERMLKEMLHVEGQLTRIARQDNGGCYHDPGVYNLTFLITQTTPTRLAGEEIRIVLTVTF